MDIHFIHKGQEEKYTNEKIEMVEWAYDNERFIGENNSGDLCASLECIFLAECQKLVWTGDKEIAYYVAVCLSHFFGER